MTANRLLIKEVALAGFAMRRSNRPAPIDNASLPAGVNMFFYCRACGWLADVKPEGYIFPVRPLCSECAGLDAEGWLPE